MGVVYDAWDERLERRVAIKHIRPEQATDSRQRQRFQREARAVARLSHPAIVQIFDIVETDEGDWIVMEHVEGRTLASLLQDGPLELSRVLPLAREVAEGLAEAHSKGFLHRDLKTENVIVTSAGHAKILDFGLAKQFWPRGTSEAISETNAIVGTRRSMSPEQANGFDLDPRSDLFSFGTLLYETVTGISPFQGATPVQTLHKVCNHQQPPAREQNPEVPHELSAMIDRLLEKTRERRPHSAREVSERLIAIDHAWARDPSGLVTSGSSSLDEPTVIEPFAIGNLEAPRTPVSSEAFRTWRWGRLSAMIVLPLMLLGLVWWLTRGVEPLYVAVSPPQLGMGRDSEEAQLLAAGVRTSVLRSLASLEGIAALACEPDLCNDRSLRAIAKALAADEVVATRLECRPRVCQISLDRIKASDGEVLWSGGFEAPTDDFELLTTATFTYLQRGYQGHQPRDDLPKLRFRGKDYERFLRLSEKFQHRSEPLEKLLAGLQEVRESSPRFLEAYLLEADIASHRFFDSRDTTDRDHALDLVRLAREMAPGDPRPLLIQFGVAFPAERLVEAEEAIRELERLVPGDARALTLRALLFERRGEIDHATALMRRAVDRRPSLKNFLALANLQYRQGAIDEVRQTLDRLLERLPGEKQGLSMLAQLELMSGSPERAAELYSQLVAETGTFAELANLGLAQLLLGRFAEAVVSLGEVLELAPNNPVAHLNYADALFLMGRHDEATDLYEEVLILVDQDPVATFWQTLTTRAQALAHLGRSRDAVAAIQQALQIAPQNPQVAYEAALVYALVGDVSSALVSSERALAGGVEKRWFSFPWFDNLRQDPQFLALVQQPTHDSGG